MKCSECGYSGTQANFRYGCPLCGNWESWMITEAENPNSETDDYYNEDPEK